MFYKPLFEVVAYHLDSYDVRNSRRKALKQPPTEKQPRILRSRTNPYAVIPRL